jgi:2,4'-dihydroxyacetophenone dioxygenase
LESGATNGYTISGKWGYLEHDWITTKGDWIFEAHTLIAYASDEPMKVTFNVFDYIKRCRDHYDKTGLGPDYVNGLFR